MEGNRMAKMIFPQYARGREGAELEKGATVLEHIRGIGGVEIGSECGGRGICGKDIIRIARGMESLDKPTPAEHRFAEQGVLKANHRLACQARVANDTEDITVFIPDFGSYTILTDTLETDVECDPSVSGNDGRVVYDTGEDCGRYEGNIYGLAIDVGTTTLVMQAVDLETGTNVGKPIASKNPQIGYGNDVISRIGYTRDNADGLQELQKAAADGINSTIMQLEKDLEQEPGEISSSIYDVVAVGNSTMRDILFGRSVETLGVIPFEPEDHSPLLCRASELGLAVHPEARIYGPGLIGGHAGADCMADIIAARIYEKDEVSMIIDIGTNGEIVIGNRDRLMTASCAAGGAYEGYQIRCGVGAVAGAVIQVAIRNGNPIMKTLNDAPPVGVCGSGVIDLLAELYKNEIMTAQTRIEKDYCLTDTVCLSQDDINQLIIAKAGLRSDQDLLLKYYGAGIDDIDSIYLAGAFGNYMNIENAMTIGLLPRAAPEQFIRFGNGALAGARDMLLSRKRRRDSERLLDMVEHTKPNEIEGSEFAYIVADNMYFT